MSHTDEHQWAQKALRDPEALRQLYNLYFPKLYAYTSYRVGNVQDAEDLVSETFLRVVERIDGFKPKHEVSFAAWLFRIAHNLINDFYRRSQRLGQEVPLDDLPSLAASALLPDDIVLQKEKFAYLHELLLTLPPRQQEVLTLRFFGELRNREIAQILNLNEKTVAAHLCRGLEDLHRKYVEDFSQTKETNRIAKRRTERADQP